MTTRGIAYGVNTKRARRRATAHFAAIRVRIDAIGAAFTGEEEDGYLDGRLEEFKRDVARWEDVMEELAQFFDEEL